MSVNEVMGLRGRLGPDAMPFCADRFANFGDA